MSGIAGFWNLDGRPADRGALADMTEVIAHRGPDATATWCRGSVGIGHRMLYTTPESLKESMPLVGASGNLVLTADARIDNRQELIAGLGLRDRPQANLTDSELILRAYERWGEECPEHLLGDFAFAIWDARRQRLFCARDHFGIKPFYYHLRKGAVFAFSSEIKALLQLADVPRQINEDRIADFIVGINGHQTLTFYEAIHRLPPAHSLTVSYDRIAFRSYWSLDASREIRFGSDAEYAEAFREVFFDAVRCRLRSAFPVGSMLSGGLDSSSIVCAARELNHSALHTYSLVFDATPDCDERPFIQAVLAQGGLVSHYVLADDLSPLEDADRYLWHMDEPFYAGNLAFQWGMHRAARSDGVRVMLDGFFGDDAVFHGYFYLSELLRNGSLLRLYNLVRAYSRNTGYPKWWAFKRHAAKPIAPASAVRLWSILHGRSTMRSLFPGDTRGPVLIRSEFAERTGADARLSARRAGLSYRTARERHYQTLIASLYTHVLELEDRVTGAFAIEPRYPFLDRRLVEFCLGVPSEQKFLGGWPKSLLRRGMAGVLPDSVCWRVGKGHLESWFYRSLLRYERPALEAMVAEPETIAPYVDMDFVRSTFDSYAGGDSQQAIVLWEPLILWNWLRRNATGAAEKPPETGPVREVGAPRRAAVAGHT